jgi:cell division protein FtsB
MREFQDRKKQNDSINKIFKSKIFFVLLLIAIYFLIQGNIRIIKNYMFVREKHAQDMNTIQTLNQREIDLDKQINGLRTEDGMDYEIRSKLDVSKSDEHVIKIIDKK